MMSPQMTGAGMVAEEVGGRKILKDLLQKSDRRVTMSVYRCEFVPGDYFASLWQFALFIFVFSSFLCHRRRRTKTCRWVCFSNNPKHLVAHVSTNFLGFARQRQKSIYSSKLQMIIYGGQVAGRKGRRLKTRWNERNVNDTKKCYPEKKE